MVASWVAKALGYIEGNDDSNGEDNLHENLVVLVQGKNVFGDKIYCYVKIPSARMNEFQKKVSTINNFDLREFGTVIAAGRGDPTQDTQIEVVQEYGLRPEDPQQTN